MFKVKIITPMGEYTELDATILNVTTTNGMRGILTDHMPLVAMIDIGILTIANEDVKPSYRYNYATGTGMLYFHDNLAQVLVETIERSDEIDLTRAEAALKRSESRMASIDKHNIDVERAKRAFRRARNRIRVKNEL
ncbi:MAG: F0F1 ATP synthase subunit epsilon [Erysipelotrichaceae bacterium]|nr:F0F1 ATP synthase subunit epsilon [Erysipelotrichaceae bacterium]MDD4642635.1 F0F1 ATP synthase subunit epsilon [Erysipelotrichaceae bacterium]